MFGKGGRKLWYGPRQGQERDVNNWVGMYRWVVQEGLYPRVTDSFSRFCSFSHSLSLIILSSIIKMLRSMSIC